MSTTVSFSSVRTTAGIATASRAGASTPEDAVVREVREETGLEVTASGLIGTIHNRDWDDPMLILVYRCEVVGGDVAIQDPGEIAELGWFDPSEYPTPSTLSGPPAVRAAVQGLRGVIL